MYDHMNVYSCICIYVHVYLLRVCILSSTNVMWSPRSIPKYILRMMIMHMFLMVFVMEVLFDHYRKEGESSQKHFRAERSCNESRKFCRATKQGRRHNWSGLSHSSTRKTAQGHVGPSVTSVWPRLSVPSIWFCLQILFGVYVNCEKSPYYT